MNLYIKIELKRIPYPLFKRIWNFITLRPTYKLLPKIIPCEKDEAMMCIVVEHGTMDRENVPKEMIQ